MWRSDGAVDVRSESMCFSSLAGSECPVFWWLAAMTLGRNSHEDRVRAESLVFLAGTRGVLEQVHRGY